MNYVIACPIRPISEKFCHMTRYAITEYLAGTHQVILMLMLFSISIFISMIPINNPKHIRFHEIPLADHGKIEDRVALYQTQLIPHHAIIQRASLIFLVSHSQGAVVSGEHFCRLSPPPSSSSPTRSPSMMNRHGYADK